MTDHDTYLIMVAMISSFASAFQSWRNQKKITEVHLLINSRMSELLEVTRMAARAAGVAEEQARAGVITAAVAESKVIEKKEG